MRTLGVIKVDPFGNDALGLKAVAQFVQINGFVLQRPRPSIEIAILASLSTPVKSVLENWLPWSVLKMSGLPYRSSACRFHALTWLGCT